MIAIVIDRDNCYYCNTKVVDIIESAIAVVKMVIMSFHFKLAFVTTYSTMISVVAAADSLFIVIIKMKLLYMQDQVVTSSLY